MDPDSYWFVCGGCGRAFQDPDAAAEHEDVVDRDCLGASYTLVDGSVVSGTPGNEVS